MAPFFDSCRYEKQLPGCFVVRCTQRRVYLSFWHYVWYSATCFKVRRWFQNRANLTSPCSSQCGRRAGWCEIVKLKSYCAFNLYVRSGLPQPVYLYVEFIFITFHKSVPTQVITLRSISLIHFIQSDRKYAHLKSQFPNKTQHTLDLKHQHYVIFNKLTLSWLTNYYRDEITGRN